MKKEDLEKIAIAAALNAGLDPALVCAVIAHESNGWKQYAMRFEPGFMRRHIDPMPDAPKDSKARADEAVRTFGVCSHQTERQGRATSWGLMQVMGQVAREFGFQGEFLSELLDPLTAVTYGCKRLKRALDKNSGSVHAALLDYNGGGDANYPDRVMAFYPGYAYLNTATRRPE